MPDIYSFGVVVLAPPPKNSKQNNLFLFEIGSDFFRLNDEQKVYLRFRSVVPL